MQENEHGEVTVTFSDYLAKLGGRDNIIGRMVVVSDLTLTARGTTLVVRI